MIDRRPHNRTLAPEERRIIRRRRLDAFRCQNCGRRAFNDDLLCSTCADPLTRRMYSTVEVSRIR